MLSSPNVPLCALSSTGYRPANDPPAPDSSLEIFEGQRVRGREKENW